MLSRRRIIASGAAAVAGGTLLHSFQALAAPPPASDAPNLDSQRAATAADSDKPNLDQAALSPGEPGKDYTPVVTPNGTALPYKLVGGVKVFHLIAEEFDHEFAPGLKARCWGYNGSTP